MPPQACGAGTIGRPGSIAVAGADRPRACAAAVDSIPRLVIRRAVGLYPGEPKPTCVTATCSPALPGCHRAQLAWTEVSGDLLAQVQVLSRYHDDLPADHVRIPNRLPHALTGLNPALKAKHGLDYPAVWALLHRHPTPAQQC